jgi:PAS domain S-box-containing protein
MNTPTVLVILTSTVVFASTLAWAHLYAHNSRLHALVQGLKYRSHRRLTYWLAQKEAALAHQRAYWERLKAFSAPVMVTTPDGEIVAGNNALLEMLGYFSEEELKHHNASDLYVDAREREFRIRAPVTERGSIRNAECRCQRRDGSVIHVLTSTRTMDTPDRGMLFEKVFTDVTELRSALEKARKLEAQLLMAQKLEAIGQLASGIAHEINTPIQFVGDNAHFLRDSFQELAGVVNDYRNAVAESLGADGATKLTAALDSIDQSAHLDRLLQEIPQAFTETFDGIQRVTETVRAMKDFAHPDAGEMAFADLNQAIQTTLVIARNEYKLVADIITDFGDLPEVMCRKGEINKVLLNLVVNAAHAIEQPNQKKRGTITIVTRQSGENVRVVVADTGCGIPTAIIDRIFDPFFTTKPLGKGTGQGLAIVKSIVKAHRGQIEVASVPGEGTRFTLTLPIRREETQKLPSLPDPDAATPSLLTGTAS